MYEIIVNCRINGVDYKKWDIVSENDTGGYWTSVMAPINNAVKTEVKTEVKAEVKDEGKEVKKKK